MAGNQAKSFQLLAGNVVVDLVNTLDFRFRSNGPEELLPSYRDLVDFARQSGLLGNAQARKLLMLSAEANGGASVLADAIKLREALAATLYPLHENRQIAPADLQTLEVLFKGVETRRVLSRRGGRLAWGWGDLRDEIAAPLWLLTQAAADLLVSDALAGLRSCANPDCRWLFLDTSKNHTRRWCDMKVCGNRMKARRFQARLAGG